MAYDPFGDQAVRGYLRNTAAANDPEVVKALELASVALHLETAASFLMTARPVTYATVREVHRRLFEDLYPWAGQDRFQLQVVPYPRRGAVHFEDSANIERAMHEALRMGNNPRLLRARPGSVLGLMAWAHPFLDGNGRTLVLVHGELCRRAHIRVAWERADPAAYLQVLAEDIEAPSVGHLDAYLQPLLELSDT